MATQASRVTSLELVSSLASDFNLSVVGNLTGVTLNATAAGAIEVITVGGSFIPGTFSAQNSTVTLNSATTPVAAGGFAYNNLTVSKTAAGNIVNLAALASVGGALTVTQGTLNLAGNLSPTGVVTVNGTLEVGTNTLTVDSSPERVLSPSAQVPSILRGPSTLLRSPPSDAASIFSGGDFSPTAFTASTSTVTFDGATTPVAAGGFAYNNLSVNKSAAGNIVNLAALASVGGNLTVTLGTLNLGGNLSVTGNLTGAGIVATSDFNLSVVGNLTGVTLNATAAGAIEVITVGGSFTPGIFSAQNSTVTLNSATTPVAAGESAHNNLSVNKSAAGDIVNLGALASVGGNLTVTQGTLNLAGNLSPTGVVTVNGTLEVGANTLTVDSLTGTGAVTVSTGTIDSTGTINVATITASDAASIFSGGAFSPTAFTASTSTVTFDGATTPVAAGGFAYNNLSVNKSAAGNIVNLGALASVGGNLTVTLGTLNLGGNLSVTGNITGAGIVATSDFNLSVVGNLTGVTLNATAAGAVEVITIGGSFIPGTFSAQNSTVTLNSATTPVAAGGFAYNNLTVSKTAAGNIVNLAALASVGGALTVTQGTLNLAGNLSPTGVVTVNGTLEVGTNTLTVDSLTGTGAVTISTGTIDSTGTINVATITASDAASIFSGGDFSPTAFTASTSTVTFDGATTPVAAGGFAYNNLSVNKSAAGNIVNLGALASVGGNLTVTLGTLNLGGNLSVTGNLTGAGIVATSDFNLSVVGNLTGVTLNATAAGAVEVITVGGSFTPGTFSAQNSTVTLNSATTPVAAGEFAYNNLSVNKSAAGDIVNLAALASVGGNLTVTLGTLT
ncbi:hypothetical protein MASR2M48_05110 [Spirochaetota bacterium]